MIDETRRVRFPRRPLQPFLCPERRAGIPVDAEFFSDPLAFRSCGTFLQLEELLRLSGNVLGAHLELLDQLPWGARLAKSILYADGTGNDRRRIKLG